MLPYLEGVTEEQGADYHAMIYGSDARSLCGGGDGAMTQCVVDGRNLSSSGLHGGGQAAGGVEAS